VTDKLREIDFENGRKNMRRKTTPINDPLQEQRQRLVEELDDINRRFKNRDDLAVEPSADELDQTRLFADRDILAQELSQDYARAVAIRAALERMDSGAYGECMECGEEIPAKRLRALPWAAYCVPCQEAMEASGGFDSDDVRTVLDTAA
jgi:DnaK suppressor protein